MSLTAQNFVRNKVIEERFKDVTNVICSHRESKEGNKNKLLHQFAKALQKDLESNK